MATSLTIANGKSLTANMGAYDNHGEGFIFASAFGYTAAVKQAEKEIQKKRSNVYFCHSYFTTDYKAYDVYTSKIPNSDYSHIVISRKDKIIRDPSGGETILSFVFIDDENVTQSLSSMCTSNQYAEVFMNKVFDKLYKSSPAPIIKEWMPYVLNALIMSGRLREIVTYTQDSDKHHFRAYTLRVETSYIVNLISTGLKAKTIAIDGSYAVSDTMKNIAGLDAYLNENTDTLTERIQKAFIPRFTPGVDQYSQVLNDLADWASYHGHMEFFSAQKAVIQATSNTLDKKQSAFIIGECGAGKTSMGIATVLTHARGRRGLTNIIMCPAHITKKWKEEIERLAPLSKAVIIDNFSDLLSCEAEIRNRKRKKDLWLIISKETAKFGYEERPAAVWSKSHKYANKGSSNNGCYVCPHCGQPLFYYTYTGSGKNRRQIVNYIHEKDMLKKNANNTVCLNSIKTWDRDNSRWKTTPCNTKLWEAFSKDVSYRNGNAADEWLKLKSGWVQVSNMEKMRDDLLECDSYDKNNATLLESLVTALDEDEKVIIKAPRKFPIAKYIHKYLSHFIDYFIADEVHLLKGGDTAQGEAFGDIAAAATKTLALTGTLLNGYASGIYYILFRLFAGQMKKEGYDYGSIEEFSREYGVIKKNESFEMFNGLQGSKIGSSKTKFLPGVSPLVFTKFFLENAAFIGLEDISDGLPGYKEIPVPVEMDRTLERAYKALEADSNVYMKPGVSKDVNCSKVMSQIVQLLSVYPDQPFGQPPVIDPESGANIVEPDALKEDVLRPKEEALISLVQRKIANGEKVLLYYHWTKRTNLGKRLQDLLEQSGLNVSVMNSSVKAKERSSWIEDKINKGMDVLICNPSLVETGLDLLDFTTIIYYQVGYNLYTMRQSSRRSWRLSQDKDIEVYFMYYKNTVQENALSLMATKLQAAMAIEGKFSEEGLNAMSNNEDILTQIASSVSEGIKNTVDVQVFEKTAVAGHKAEKKEFKPTLAELMVAPSNYSPRDIYLNSKKKGKTLWRPDNYVKSIHNNPMMLMELL